MYHVIEKVKSNGYTKLQLQKATDSTYTFWWQISSTQEGTTITCTFDTSPPTSYYKYWGNVLVRDTDLIGEPMGLSTLEHNQTIDFDNLEHIPNCLQNIYEYE